jgi:hypothetical protein
MRRANGTNQPDILNKPSPPLLPGTQQGIRHIAGSRIGPVPTECLFTRILVIFAALLNGSGTNFLPPVQTTCKMSSRLRTKQGVFPMPGVNPYVYMQQVAVRLTQLTDRNEIETLLDEVEYLYEVIDPELQGSADQLIAQLRSRLEAAS